MSEKCQVDLEVFASEVLREIIYLYIYIYINSGSKWICIALWWLTTLRYIVLYRPSYPSVCHPYLIWEWRYAVSLHLPDSSYLRTAQVGLVRRGEICRCLQVQIPAALFHALLNSLQGGLSQVSFTSPPPSYLWGKHVCRKHQLAFFKGEKGLCFIAPLAKSPWQILPFVCVQFLLQNLNDFAFCVVRSSKAPCEELGILFHFNRVMSCRCEWNICSCESSLRDQPSPGSVSYLISCLSFSLCHSSFTHSVYFVVRHDVHISLLMSPVRQSLSGMCQHVCHSYVCFKVF